jgi:hypothetical protein
VRWQQCGGFIGQAERSLANALQASFDGVVAKAIVFQALLVDVGDIPVNASDIVDNILQTVGSTVPFRRHERGPGRRWRADEAF